MTSAAGRGARPLRALLVVDSLSNNGATHITVELARRWAPAGARLAVLQRPVGQVPVVPAAEVSVRHLSAPGTRLRRQVLTAFARLLALARSSDVVVGGSEIGVAFVGGFVAARLTRRPFIVAVHADLDQALDEWMPTSLHAVFRWLHRRVDGAVCVAPGLVAPLLRNGLGRDRVRVVRNGVDPAEVRRAAKGPGSLVNAGEAVVVATGRLAPQKGYDLLLRAHADVVRELPHRLLILNDGPERQALEALTAELQVQGSVTFAGAVRAPLPSVAHATVFCLPSRHEGLPLALLEAVTLGVPIIAADCSDGVRAAVDHGRVGELVPVGDQVALTQSLARHLRDPAPLRLRARSGPDHAGSFDSGAMAAGWADALDDLRAAALIRARRTSAPRL